MSPSLPSTNCPRFRPQPLLSLRASIAFGNANISRVLADWLDDWIARPIESSKEPSNARYILYTKFLFHHAICTRGLPKPFFHSLLVFVPFQPFPSFLPSVGRFKKLSWAKWLRQCQIVSWNHLLFLETVPGRPKRGAHGTWHVQKCSWDASLSFFPYQIKSKASSFLCVLERTYLALPWRFSLK